MGQATLSGRRFNDLAEAAEAQASGAGERVTICGGVDIVKADKQAWNALASYPPLQFGGLCGVEGHARSSWCGTAKL